MRKQQTNPNWEMVYLKKKKEKRTVFFKNINVLKCKGKLWKCFRLKAAKETQQSNAIFGLRLNPVVVVFVAKSCPTPCDPMDDSPPGSSVHGISQARMLERVAISFSSRSSWRRDKTHVSCIFRRILYCWATREAQTRSCTEGKKKKKCYKEHFF